MLFMDNLKKYSNVACDVLSNSNSLDKVRGFYKLSTIWELINMGVFISLK